MKQYFQVRNLNSKIKKNKQLTDKEIGFLEKNFSHCYFNFDIYKKSLLMGNKKFSYDRFLKWKTPLIEMKISEITDDIFFEIDPKYLSNTAILGRKYYEDRYPPHYADAIHNYIKTSIREKRGNMYDIQHVSEKHKLSWEEAQKSVDTLKAKTGGALHNFIKRHGEEEGRKKFEMFRKKSESSKDNYKIRYGDAWEKKWNHFLATRDSSSLEYWQAKLGVEEGTQKFQDLCVQFSKSSQRSYYIEKYGLDQGNLLFNEVTTKRIDALMNCKGPSRISKESNTLFVKLEKLLDQKCYYGYEELRLMTESGKYYFYDFYHEVSNTIIEYNGSAFHPSPKLTPAEWKFWKQVRSDKTADEVFEYNKTKIDFARNSDYNVVIIWDYEIRGESRFRKKVLELEEILRANYKDTENRETVEYLQIPH